MPLTDPPSPFSVPEGICADGIAGRARLFDGVARRSRVAMSVAHSVCWVETILN